MKKIFKCTAVLALLFTTATAFANEPKISVTPQEDSKSIIVRVDASASESHIKLIDNDYRTLYAEQLSDADYVKKFNLKDLEKGTYYLEVENGKKSVQYAIEVKENIISVGKIQENSAKPVFRKVGNKIYLNLLNVDLNTVRVKVFNGGNQEVEDQIFNGYLIVDKVYNFEKALKDTYSVVVQDGKKVYRLSIAVK